MSIYKPAKPHNSLLGPAVCLCRDCSQFMLTRRCDALAPDDGSQCGFYKDHKGDHSKLPASVFLIAAERAETQEVVK